MRSILLTGLAITLIACGGPGPKLPPQQDVVREVVRDAIKESLGAKYPNVPTEGLVDCVIDNATDEEIKNLASATLLESEEGGVLIVAPILQRPTTIACIAKKVEEAQ